MAEVTIAGAVVKGGGSIWNLWKWGRATINYKTRLESVEGRFNSAAATVERLKENRSIEDVQLKLLENLKKECQELFEQFSPSSNWGPLRFLFYTDNLDKLEKREANLTRHCTHQMADESNTKLTDILNRLSESDKALHQLSDLHGAPRVPECVGMYEPLNWLRIKLLNDDVYETVIVLTGLGGSG